MLTEQEPNKQKTKEPNRNIILTQTCQEVEHDLQKVVVYLNFTWCLNWIVVLIISYHFGCHVFDSWLGKI